MSTVHKMSTPQVERIERLPTRRMSNEPREAMNCKSCRRRKIKCNRLKPTCEACQSFNQICIYDATPKKRGPKTDVIESLVKRVEELEKIKSINKENENGSSNEYNDGSNLKPEKPTVDTTVVNETAVYSPTPTTGSESSPTVLSDVLLDTYFNRIHGKPYHILDETSTRQRLQHNQIPDFLLHALYAVSARYSCHPNGYHAEVSLSNHHASLARSEIDLDEPSIDAMQACLLLTIAFTAAGKGKKTYMMLSNAVGMAMALDLHREVDSKTRITPVERESRRRLFWTCYIMDRFIACGSKRPSLIDDKAILLKLPSWSPNPSTLPIEGEFFQAGSNLQYTAGSGKQCQGSSGMLIDIARILGVTNRYLAAGGVKGDSHFPWHSLSNLSQIRQDLDIWGSGCQNVFSSVETLFSQPDITTLVLSKLIYHLIHCLIYRPFLPIDLSELAGTGQHQSWQIEATHLCFQHARSITDLVELGKQSPTIERPAFVGYCICTAGTVHVHGAYYSGGRDGEGFNDSADFLSREMQQLSELRYSWACVQHQIKTLQTIYGCHSELVKTLSSNPMRYSPVFHLEDFFDRYSSLEQYFDGAHISFDDVLDGSVQEVYTGHDLYATRNSIHGSGSSCENSAFKVRKPSSTMSAAKRKFSSNSRNGKKIGISGGLLSPLPTGNRMQHQLPLQSNNFSFEQQQNRLNSAGISNLSQPHNLNSPSMSASSLFENASQHMMADISGSEMSFSAPYSNPFHSPSTLSSHSQHGPFDLFVPTLSSQGGPNYQASHQGQNQNQGPTSNPSTVLHSSINNNQNQKLGGVQNLGTSRSTLNGSHQEASQGKSQMQEHFLEDAATPIAANQLNGTQNYSQTIDTPPSPKSLNNEPVDQDDTMPSLDSTDLEMVSVEGEMDPFLSLLEQLVENES